MIPICRAMNKHLRNTKKFNQKENKYFFQHNLITNILIFKKLNSNDICFSFEILELISGVSYFN